MFACGLLWMFRCLLWVSCGVGLSCGFGFVGTRVDGFCGNLFGLLWYLLVIAFGLLL